MAHKDVVNQGRRNWAWPACVVLVAVGLALSGYLFYRTLAIEGAEGASSFDICSELLYASCDDALQSDGSWYLGFPVSGWGFVYFSTYAALLALGRVLKDAFMRPAAVAMILWNAIGIGVAAALFTQFLNGVPFCPLCLGVHFVLLALFPCVVMLYAQGPRSFYQDLLASLSYVFGREVSSPTEATWRVVGFVAVALVGIVVYQWLLLRTNEAIFALPGPADWQSVLREFQESPLLDVPIGSSDPRTGPASAPVQLVVFSSLQCPGCRDLARNLDTLQAQYGDRLAVVFKHFPLGTACNPSVGRDVHPRSCDLAAAAIAADYQDKFWAFQDRIFNGDRGADDARVQEIASEIGLALEDFERDRHSAETLRKLQEDIELGMQLDVEGTPTVFLNGKRVSPEGLSFLELLVDDALGELSRP